MKRVVIMVLFLASVVTSTAQGTLSYHVRLTGDQVVPPSGSIDTAEGTLSFDTTTRLFSGSFFFHIVGSTVSIHGPATSGSLAPVLFDLTPGGVVGPGGEGDPGGQDYSVSRVLTGSEIDQLNLGLWYMEVRNGGYPDGELRGQILAVPEPSSIALLGFGAVAFWRVLRKTAKTT